ncbi:MAG: type III-B CRISPR module RAMP protein Cmr6 [Pseudomonadota bacterium]
MKHKMTAALRPVSKSVNAAIGDLPSGPFNFGLYFQKWLYVVDGNRMEDKWKRGNPWACSLSDESEVEKRGDICDPNYRLDNLAVSLALFNGERTYTRKFPKKEGERFKAVPASVPVPGSWDRETAATLLEARHNSFERIAEAYKKLGYEYVRHAVPLISPLVLGLGNEHPTKKGFRFDWTMGIPFIPSSGIKGVVRLAMLVNLLNEKTDEKELEEFCRALVKGKTLPDSVREIFGFAGDKEAGRGKVIFLDAYPETVPRLKSEIMNCHYHDYLKKTRGPTEDQQPTPQRFWAVDHGADESGRPFQFVFRLLLSSETAGNEEYRGLLNAAFKAALEEHGLGAKTAVGHGRFTMNASVGRTPLAGQAQHQPDPAVKKKYPVEVWPQAVLNWNAGNATLVAEWQGKHAHTTGKDVAVKVIPEVLHERVFAKKKKRKAVPARVTVEVRGTGYTVIVKVEAP